MSNHNSDNTDDDKPHQAHLTVVCEQAGKVVAIAGAPSCWRPATPAAEAALPAGSSSADIDADIDDAVWRSNGLPALVGAESELADWISGHLQEVNESNFCCANSRIAHNGNAVDVKIERLRGADGPFGYAVHLSKGLDGNAIREMDRRQWHDIKNHLGGLKLYATFLRKKIPDTETQQIVEKLLNSINSLIDQLARIRRGETT